MHSDSPMFNFFKKLLRMKLKAEFMRKIELNTNRRDWKECENNKKNVHAKHKNVIKNIKGKKSLRGNAAVTSPVAAVTSPADLFCWLSSLLQVKVQWCHDYFLGTLVII